MVNRYHVEHEMPKKKNPVTNNLGNEILIGLPVPPNCDGT